MTRSEGGWIIGVLAVPIKDVAIKDGRNYHFVHGLAVGMGLAVRLVGTSYVVSEGDAKRLALKLQSYRRPTGATVPA